MKQSKVLSEYERLCGVREGRPDKLRQNVAVSQEDIAKQFGVDVRTIQRLKKLQDLVPELQNLVEDGSLKPTTALLWARIDQINIAGYFTNIRLLNFKKANKHFHSHSIEKNS